MRGGRRFRIGSLAGPVGCGLFLCLLLLIESLGHTIPSPPCNAASASLEPSAHVRTAEKLPAEETSPALREVAVTIGKGGTLSKAVAHLPLPPGIGAEVPSWFSGVVDLRALQPSDRLSLYMAEDGRPVRMRLFKGRLERYVVELDEGEGRPKAEAEAVTLSRKVILVSGDVDGSLFSSFERTGEGPKLVIGFAGIFSSLIDFNTECHDGDRFSVIVEKYYDGDTFVGYGRILAASYAGKAGSFEAYAWEDGKGLKYFDAAGAEVGTSFLRSPLPFYRVSSRFSKRRFHPILKHYRPHLGIDLAAPAGTPVMAAADGVVVFAGWRRGFGRTVVIRHPGSIRSYYGHLSRFAKGVRKGAKVKKGQVIGRVGSSGMSTGPHLDYRIKVHGRFMNPFDLRFQPKSRLEGKYLARFRRDTALWRSVILDKKGKVVLHVDERQVLGRPEDWLG